MNNPRPRILLVYPYASIDTNPTMALLLESLAERKVEVDVLLERSDDFLQPKLFGDSIHLEPLPNAFWELQQIHARRLLKSVPKKLLVWYAHQAFANRLPKQFLVKILNSDRYYAPLNTNSAALKLLIERQYSLIIGVDSHGIAFADHLNAWMNKRLVYISFELIPSRELESDYEKNLKRMEQIACEKASLVLIQDDERAAAFCQDNPLPDYKIVKVPVAPPPQEVAKSNYFRKILGLPADKRIVLYSGALETWASRDQLSEMVSYWPDEYCLVIHLRSKPRARMALFLRQLTETGKIHISPHPVARADLPGLIASADYGLAPYRPVPDNPATGANVYHLGLSSGKVAYYAMCGLPILARSLPVFDREFANYKCGKVYQKLAETGPLLEEMNSNYASYSDEARRFYRERLNPVEGMHKFCNYLLDLAVKE